MKKSILENYNSGISREQYQKLIEKELNKAANWTDFKYKKNSKEMFSFLNKYGNLENAIENAEKLENLYVDRSFSNHNPCTKVHKLINKLIELTEKYAAQQQI